MCGGRGEGGMGGEEREGSSHETSGIADSHSNCAPPPPPQLNLGKPNVLYTQIVLQTRSRPYVPEEQDGPHPQQRPRLPSNFSRLSTGQPRATRHSSFSHYPSDRDTSPAPHSHLEPTSPAPSGEVPHPHQFSPTFDSPDSDSSK